LKGEVNEKVSIVRYVMAVLVGAVSTSAVAKNLKQNKEAPYVSATQMTNSKMDKVAASTFSGANDNGRLGSGIDGVSR